MKSERKKYTIDEYKLANSPDRLIYLHTYITDNSEISEKFLINALDWEIFPLAKWYLVKGLGILRSTIGIFPIVDLCKGPEISFGHTSLHAICAWSLGRIGKDAFLPTMSLLDENNIDTRKCVADALGEIGDNRALPILFSLLTDDPSLRVQLWAGLSLSKFGEEAIPYLEKSLFKSSNIYVQTIALDAIAKIKNL